jgi:hypothetical protein
VFGVVALPTGMVAPSISALSAITTCDNEMLLASS